MFTSHTNDILLYAYIQSKLGGIGRFQLIGDNKIRYIIGEVKGIIRFITLVNNKLITPKIEGFNELIKFINIKYKLSMPKGILDKSNLSNNGWLSGFSEPDGHLGL